CDIPPSYKRFREAPVEDVEEGTPRRAKSLRGGLSAGVTDVAVLALIDEAARTAERLDEMDRFIQGKGELDLFRLRSPHAFGDDGGDDKNVTVEVKFDSVLAEARQQANVLRQILVTLGVGKVEAAAPEEPKRTALDELKKRREERRAGAARQA